MFDPELDNDDDGGIEKQEDDNEIAPQPKPEKAKTVKEKKPRSDAQQAAFQKMQERRKALLEEKRNKSKQPKPEIEAKPKRKPAKVYDDNSESSSDEDIQPKLRGKNKKSVTYNYYYGASPMMMPGQFQPSQQEQIKPQKQPAPKAEPKPEPPKEAKNVTKKILFA